MIRELEEVASPELVLQIFYSGLASAVAMGVVLGLCAIWLSVAARGSDSS